MLDHIRHLGKNLKQLVAEVVELETNYPKYKEFFDTAEEATEYEKVTNSYLKKMKTYTKPIAAKIPKGMYVRVGNWYVCAMSEYRLEIYETTPQGKGQRIVFIKNY